MFNRNPSAVRASREAAFLNAGMGGAQLLAGAFTGNLGFLGEALHNLSDSASFGLKSKALESGKEKVRQLRLGATAIFFAGGASGIVSGVVELSSDKIHENASPLAIGVALGCAAVNTVVAVRSHRSVKNEETGEIEILSCSNHNHTHGADHNDEKNKTRLNLKGHAITDACTGWLYALGLVVHAKLTGQIGSELAILTNGIISSIVAWRQLDRSNKA